MNRMKEERTDLTIELKTTGHDELQFALEAANERTQLQAESTDKARIYWKPRRIEDIKVERPKHQSGLEKNQKTGSEIKAAG